MQHYIGKGVDRGSGQNQLKEPGLQGWNYVPSTDVALLPKSKYSAILCKLDNYCRIYARLKKEDIEKRPKIDSILELLRIILDLICHLDKDKFTRLVQKVLKTDKNSALLLEWSLKKYSYSVLVLCNSERTSGVLQIPKDDQCSSYMSIPEDNLHALLKKCEAAVLKLVKRHKCSEKEEEKEHYACDICEDKQNLEIVFGNPKNNESVTATGSLDDTVTSDGKCQDSELSEPLSKGKAQETPF